MYCAFVTVIELGSVYPVFALNVTVAVPSLSIVVSPLAVKFVRIVVMLYVVGNGALSKTY